MGDAFQACKAFVQRAHDTFGRLDILVNNAAYQMEQQGIEEITHEQLERTFRTNIFGYFFMVQAALPFLKEGAAIVNTGSVTALEGNEGLIDYSATKGAIHTFTKSLASSLAEKGIRVNCIAPGPVWTPLIPATLEPGHVRKFGKDTMRGAPRSRRRSPLRTCSWPRRTPATTLGGVRANREDDHALMASTDMRSNPSVGRSTSAARRR